MTEDLYLGIDLGTSFIKAAAYDLSGHRHAQASEPVADERPAPGVFLQHGEQLFASVCRCICRVTQLLGTDAGKIRAAAFTGQMAGSMGVDEQWNDVTTWSCSLDSRYLPWAARQLESFGEDLYRLSGTSSPVMCGKLDWFRDEFPEEAARIAKYVMLNGYVIGKLSGIDVREAAIDYSLTAWTGLADLKAGQWSEKICSELQIDPVLLPNMRECTHIGGRLSQTMASKLGLPPELPLILGAGDKVAGCVGSAISENGDKIFETSSYAALSVQVADFRPDEEKKEYDIIGNIDSDHYYVHKYLQGSGITLDWFVREFVQAEGEDTGEAFRRIEKLAQAVRPGSDQMLAVGLLGGSAMPFQPDQRGLFFGHTWAHGKGHFYRSLLEGFSYELAILLDRIDAIYPEYHEGAIRLIGGGARSAIWPQMLADITGRRFSLLDRDDTALWGAALLGAVGVGDLKDLHGAAKAAVHEERCFVPDPESHRLYLPYVRQYSTLRRELQPYYASLRASC